MKSLFHVDRSIPSKHRPPPPVPTEQILKRRCCFKNSPERGDNRKPHLQPCFLSSYPKAGSPGTLTAESLGLAEQRLRIPLQLALLLLGRPCLLLFVLLLLRGVAPLAGGQQLLLARPLQPQPAAQAAQHGSWRRPRSGRAGAAAETPGRERRLPPLPRAPLPPQRRGTGRARAERSGAGRTCRAGLGVPGGRVCPHGAPHVYPSALRSEVRYLQRLCSLIAAGQVPPPALRCARLSRGGLSSSALPGSGRSSRL